MRQGETLSLVEAGAHGSRVSGSLDALDVNYEDKVVVKFLRVSTNWLLESWPEDCFVRSSLVYSGYVVGVDVCSSHNKLSNWLISAVILGLETITYYEESLWGSRGAGTGSTEFADELKVCIGKWRIGVGAKIGCGAISCE